MVENIGYIYLNTKTRLITMHLEFAPFDYVDVNMKITVNGEEIRGIEVIPQKLRFKADVNEQYF